MKFPLSSAGSTHSGVADLLSFSQVASNLLSQARDSLEVGVEPQSRGAAGRHECQMAAPATRPQSKAGMHRPEFAALLHRIFCPYDPPLLRENCYYDITNNVILLL